MSETFDKAVLMSLGFREPQNQLSLARLGFKGLWFKGLGFKVSGFKGLGSRFLEFAVCEGWS